MKVSPGIQIHWQGNLYIEGMELPKEAEKFHPPVKASDPTQDRPAQPQPQAAP